MTHRYLLRLLGLTLVGFLASAPAAASWTSVSPCQRSPVAEVPVVENGANGSARLCVETGRLTAKGVMRNLAPGNAYTVWWVYIDQPGECEGGFLACVQNFFGGDDPKAVFGLMDSGIASRRGTLYFSDTLNSMDPSPNARIWFLAFGHGPADLNDGRRLARQLLTPEDPDAGAPFLGVVGAPRGYPVAEAIFTVR